MEETSCWSGEEFVFCVTQTRLWDRDYGGAATVVATFVAISTRVYWRLRVLKKESFNFCAQFWNVVSVQFRLFLFVFGEFVPRWTPRVTSGVEFTEFVAGKLSSFAWSLLKVIMDKLDLNSCVKDYFWKLLCVYLHWVDSAVLVHFSQHKLLILLPLQDARKHATA